MTNNTYFSLSEEDKKEIMMKAAKQANKEQKAMVENELEQTRKGKYYKRYYRIARLKIKLAVFLYKLGIKIKV